MSPLNRRQCLNAFLGGLVGAAGTVVLASAALPACAAEGATTGPGEGDVKDLEQRADRVAGAQDPPSDDGQQFTSFLNGGFVNGGGFRKGAFANGGFANGGFRKAGWVNGGWRN
jgi:DMSO/TMAO reductase YedYZ molybdopterin-dependent catalytic subunit